ncbi:MAG: 2-oxoacid:acceptor oxidoreductase subunit alpha [Rhodospirillales bacterium]
MLDQPIVSDSASDDAGMGPAVVRFAGDSGDGIQTLGAEFTKSSALTGHGFMTFPDFPAEIRAPAGTTFGVSAFQIQIGGDGVLTHGDTVDVLVALNPAALKTNLPALRPGGLLIVDADAFAKRGLEKAGYTENPLGDGSLDEYRLEAIEMARLTREAAMPAGVTKKEAETARNFWALGLIYWMFNQDRAPTAAWLKSKFAKRPEIAAANMAAMDAGHTYGDVTDMAPPVRLRNIAPSTPQPGIYRTLTGIDGMVFGLAAASALSGLRLHYCSYPITPASAVLHGLAKLGGEGVATFQAEDEIAAATAAIGASFAGGLGVTGTSGPGMALKAEALGLATAAELPLIVIDIQRAGPSTGMPTKVEQADLNLALFGRHGEAPLPVFAASSPGDSFDMMIEAARVATTFMTPVIVLSDAYTANAAEPWRLPDVDALADIAVDRDIDPDGFHPFRRDADTLARPWAVPGMPGLAHRLGGIERSSGSGHISYDPDNHQQMTDLRAGKLGRIQATLPAAQITSGADVGRVLAIGWGSTHGALRTAVEDLAAEGHAVGHLHLRHLSPLPRGLAEIFALYDRVVVAELNSGQLRAHLQGMFPQVSFRGLNKVTGQPFTVAEIDAALREDLS